MSNKYRIIVLLSFLAFISIQALKLNAQVFIGGSNTAAKQDTAKKAVSKLPKKFTELITSKAASDSGMFNLFKLDDKYYLEIADTLLNRDMLIVSRISKSAAENRNPQTMLGYGGDQINNNVIRFDKGPNHKLFLRKTSFAERAGDSTGVMYRSVLNSNIQPIVAAFDIKAFSKKENGVLIDITDYLNGDNDVLFFDPQVKTALKLGGVQADRSYVMSVKSYPENLEIKTMKTYSKSGAAAMPGMPIMGGGFATYELNTSIVLLPAKQMRPRFADARVGYFATGYTDFSSNPQGIAKVAMITRWRLEPKPADVQRYLAGELVEPAKPIVFYIDPATPKAWVPYLIQGINDWSIAFEKAGFKNAIIANEAPTAAQDSTWSLEDARFSGIVYKSSDIPNASGPHVNDPRTGEILETHVNWYHNVMKLLRNWYFIQASAVDPRARKMKLDEQLMGQLIRFVSSHEVGHTLGLRHNYGSSSTVSVEKLRNKAWVEANGHTPSIMDYARFNYVAQPEDGISEAGIFPRIGDYDKWAIEWAYRWYPADRFKSAEAEKAYLNSWIIEKTKDKRLWFGTEQDVNDPRCQNEDLGDDAMLAGGYGIKNLKRILPNILKWSKEDNEGYENATELYGELLNQFNRYLGHVVKNIGGVMTTPKAVEEPGAVVAYVPKVKQKQAMAFLQQQLFTTPTWLLNKELFSKTGSGTANTIRSLHNGTLVKLMDAGTLYKLNIAEAAEPLKAYAVSEMISDLQGGIFSELLTGKAISVYRRNLQKSYLDKLMKIIKPGPLPIGQMVNLIADPEMWDVSSVAKAKLKELQALINRSLPKTTDKMSRIHLQDLKERIIDFNKDRK